MTDVGSTKTDNSPIKIRPNILNDVSKWGRVEYIASCFLIDYLQKAHTCSVVSHENFLISFIGSVVKSIFITARVRS